MFGKKTLKLRSIPHAARMAALILASAVSGLAMARSLDMTPAAWLIGGVSMAPLLLATLHVAPTCAFILGFVAGTIRSIAFWAWLPATIRLMTRDATSGVPFVALMVLYWAVAIALFCSLASFACGRSRGGGSPGRQSPVCLLAVPCLWTALEFGTTSLLADWPPLSTAQQGYALWGLLPLLQVAATTGLYGLSFLVAMVNQGLAMAIMGRTWRPAVATAVVVALCSLGGLLRMILAGQSSQPPTRIAILQGNIEPTAKFDRSRSEELALRYMALGRECVASRPQLVVWTESAIPWRIEEGDDLTEAMLRITAPARSCHLLGTLSLSETATNLYRNTVYMIYPDGKIVGRHDKIRMLPFAERPVRVPIVNREVSFSAAPLGMRLEPGRAISLLTSPAGEIGVLFCNENLCPALSRAMVKRGANLLVTVANDAWCAGPLPLRQHFVVSIIRAVETGRDLIVANNSGISGIIDSLGRIRLQTAMRTPVCAVGLAQVRLSSTPYVRYGDVFAWLCSVSAAAFLLARRLRSSRVMR